ncbi:hypothetical protein [uncultured Clostridium sp.]|uniref:hypothetical protein n=1 Tax=uncultured Clostridium sp. TaxID=59620 RepID=UPI0025E0DB37|nr:hypothetical protein [uncultured Clostridium sp.]
MSIGENIDYKKVSVHGNITSFDNMELDYLNGRQVFDLLGRYNYKRIFNFNDDTGGDGEFIFLKILMVNLE